MKERIILSVEWVDGEHDSRFSVKVPYTSSAISLGPWLIAAIESLRAHCKEEMAEQKKECGQSTK